MTLNSPEIVPNSQKIHNNFVKIFYNFTDITLNFGKKFSQNRSHPLRTTFPEMMIDVGVVCYFDQGASLWGS